MPTTKSKKPKAQVPVLDTVLPLSELVTVRPRFLRSVNLERDFHVPGALDDYVPTPSAQAALERIAEGVGNPSRRAWSITGPYGTGKSAFALLLCKTLCEDGPPLSGFATSPPSEQGKGQQLQPPALTDESLPRSGNTIPRNAGGFLPVLVTGGREPLTESLARGLEEGPPAPILGSREREELSPAPRSGMPPTGKVARQVAQLYEQAARDAMARDPQCRGLLLVVDELGKSLEYAALHPERGDVQVLQELAEAAVRSTDAPLMIVTVLHQAFDEYAHRLSGTQQAEWRKVQGRFADVPFGDAADDAVRLVAGAVARVPHSDADPLLADTFARYTDECHRLGVKPRSISDKEWKAILRGSYPLHPLALLAGPHVFRRFGQNERSLFGFLASGETFGFADFLARHALTADTPPPALHVADLYDYVTNALGPSLAGHAQAGKLWAATQDALLRCENRPPVWAALVKTVGLLHALGESARLLPSRDMLHFACDDFAPAEIDAALEGLQSSTLLMYRHYRRAFRPYEGSDVDIEARVREARADAHLSADPVGVAARLSLSSLPIVARRHSYQTGTLRAFDVRPCRPADLQNAATFSVPPGVDGLVLLCLTGEGGPPSLLAPLTGFPLKGGLGPPPVPNAGGVGVLPAHVLLRLVPETDALRGAAADLESLWRVQEETGELLTDPVAQREVDERLREATAVFQSEWDALLREDPAEREAMWVWQGQPRTGQSLQELLSASCDAAYRYTPRLRNELINRRQLTSVAASARRELITAMLTRAADPRLGIEGWPPEASMYVSVLQETGLHRDGGFFPPFDASDPLFFVWSAIEDFLFGGALEPKSLLDLHTLLTSPPFGLADGVIPVLLCAALLHHANEVLVYEENRFVTLLDAATFERMMKRPEDYALQGCKVTGERQAVVERFARGLIANEEPTLVNVVRALFRNFARLPEYTVKTRRLPEKVRLLRDEFKEARGPEQLLFVNLPTLLGCQPFTAEEIDTENVAAFFEQWNTTYSGVMNAYAVLLTRIEESLCEAFGAEDWTELHGRSAQIKEHLTEPRLVAFVLRAVDETLGRQKWLEAIGAVVIGRPPAGWSDAEEKRFAPLLQPLAAAFAHSELLAFEKTRRREEAREEQTGEGERVGLRYAVTHDTGAEDTSLVFLSRQKTIEVSGLTDEVFERFNAIMNMHKSPHEVRLAVIGQVMQRVMREKNTS